MHVNSWGSQWRMVPSVTRDVSALPRTVAARLPGRRAWGLAVAWMAGWLPGASTHEPRASLQTALPSAEHRRVLPVPIRAAPWENFCVSAELGWARSPWLRGACRCGLLLAQRSRALPEPAPPPPLPTCASDHSLREGYEAKWSHLHCPCGEDRSLQFYFFRKCYQMCW